MTISSLSESDASGISLHVGSSWIKGMVGKEYPKCPMVEQGISRDLYAFVLVLALPFL